MGSQLDEMRIAQLRRAMGSELEEILNSLIKSMSSAIEEVDAALRAGELDRARRAAHLCRNDALMVGARELQEALSRVESASREAQPEAAWHAMEPLRRLWPAAREELEHLAHAGGAR